MALAPEDVDEFMAAEKVVPGTLASGKSRLMEWEKPEADRYFWRAPIEVDAVRVGELFVFANPNFNRFWLFKLSLRGEIVREWHVRPMPGGHNNPPGRPADFPAKCPEAEHEHVWVEGLDCMCARPLPGLESSDHAAILNEFCTRTNVRFEPEYVAPQAGEQMTMESERESDDR